MTIASQTIASLSKPDPLAGRRLAVDEPPAGGARSLSPAQQRALIALLEHDRLDFAGRLGWRSPTGNTSRIAPETITHLESLALVVVVSKSKFQKHARATKRGNWYARTLMSRAIADAVAMAGERLGKIQIDNAVEVRP